MPEAIILSDLHLGSDNCQARSLHHFLDALAADPDRPHTLILNGDVFDSIDFRRLTKHHWKVLSRLRKLSDAIRIVWIVGNHDGDPEFVSHLLGVDIASEYVLDSGGRRILVLHGHQFDRFIETYPRLTWLADCAYGLLQRLFTHRVARFAKHTSKTFLRCTDKVHHAAIAHARAAECDAVCCGHTHRPLVDSASRPAYFNSGSWTEQPCHYLSVGNGVVTLCEYREEPAESAAAVVERNIRPADGLQWGKDFAPATSVGTAACVTG